MIPAVFLQTTAIFMALHVFVSLQSCIGFTGDYPELTASECLAFALCATLFYCATALTVGQMPRFTKIGAIISTLGMAGFYGTSIFHEMNMTSGQVLFRGWLDWMAPVLCGLCLPVILFVPAEKYKAGSAKQCLGGVALAVVLACGLLFVMVIPETTRKPIQATWSVRKFSELPDPVKETFHKDDHNPGRLCVILATEHGDEVILSDELGKSLESKGKNDVRLERVTKKFRNCASHHLEVNGEPVYATTSAVPLHVDAYKNPETPKPTGAPWY